MFSNATKAIVLAIALSVPAMAQDGDNQKIASVNEALRYAQNDQSVRRDQTEANRTTSEVETLGEITITDQTGGGGRLYQRLLAL
jgi:hypothetical protein